ncbi:MAG: sirohydrochlorin cobaltochelatase [Oscillospiraceae bacterium]|nr:sirohydrochlorin cobaltochelatase [Oscillospiraceae bacterium]
MGFGSLAALAREAAEVFAGYDIVTAKTAAEGLRRTKTQTVFVQPVLLLPGVEYEKLREESACPGKQVVIGKPLLASPVQVRALAGILCKEYTGETVLFVGHGTAHPASAFYGELAQTLRKNGLPRSFLGVLEGEPDFEAVAEKLSRSGIEKLLLVPLMLTAGMHVREGILGESAASWFSRLTRMGLRVTGVERGLLDYPGVRQMLLGSIVHALAEAE